MLRNGNDNLLFESKAVAKMRVGGIITQVFRTNRIRLKRQHGLQVLSRERMRPTTIPVLGVMWKSRETTSFARAATLHLPSTSGESQLTALRKVVAQVVSGVASPWGGSFEDSCDLCRLVSEQEGTAHGRQGS